MSRLPSVFILCALVVLTTGPILQSQDYAPPKTAIDGILTDWGRPGQPYMPDKSHLFDNEAQALDNAEFKFGLVPPGEDPNAPADDNPMAAQPVDPAGWPMGNAFNIVSMFVSFDPTHQGGTYWVAIDLPGPTNNLLSDGFLNRFWQGTFTWYPPPFDSDCNEDKTIVDLPGSIVDPDLSDLELETYTIELWVAGDSTQALDAGDGMGADDDGQDYNGPGFPIVIELKMQEKFNPNVLEVEARIPGTFTKNSQMIDLVALGLFSHSSPHQLIAGEYDIEVECKEIIDTIWPLIDPDKINWPINDPPPNKLDLYEAYVNAVASSLGDLSNEEAVDVGILTPPLPMIVAVEKTVFCGECDFPEISSVPGDKGAIALPGSNVKFFVTVTIPQNNPGHATGVNGCGYLFGKDIVPEINNYTTWELCEDEITVNGVKDVIKIPDFDIANTEWIAKDFNDTNVDYLFNPTNGDVVVVIPFRVTTNPAFNTKNTPVDLNNFVEVWGYNGQVESTHVNSDAQVNLLVSELVCFKEVKITDNNNVTYGPGPNVFVPKTAIYPLVAEWTFRITNNGETRVHLDQDAIDEFCLCLIPDLSGTPFCNGNTIPPQDIDPLQSAEAKVQWTIGDYQEYKDAVTLLFNNGCGNGDQIWNQFNTEGEVVIQVDIGGLPVYICHIANQVEVVAKFPDCESNVVTFKIEAPNAEILVEKTVTCNPEASTSPKLAEVLPGADVIFKLKVINSGQIDHEHTWFTDTLVGSACTYANDFKILTPGFTISPVNFFPNGTQYEILPALKVGEAVEMTFLVDTDQNYNTMGVSPECTNTLFGEADGPDPDTVPEDSDDDFAEIDILIPSIFCTKEVFVQTQDNSYGPQQKITNIPRTDKYPWQVTWSIFVTNDGETYLDATVTDALIENFTQNNCSLPQGITLSPGQTIQIDCDENVLDYNSNVVLDTNDVDGLDAKVHNVVEGLNIQVDPDQPGGTHICHTNQGVNVPAFTPNDISCDAEYNLPAPCGEIEIVDKGVACVQQGPFVAKKEAVPGAFVYFKFTVRNPSTTIDLEHAYVIDTLTGPWTAFQAIDPPGFQLGVQYDLGPLLAGQSKDVLYRVTVNPNYNTMGVPDEIKNSLVAKADGPDVGSEPDPLNECPDAEDTLAKGVVDILIPSLLADKLVTVMDNIGKTWGPDKVVSLDGTEVYPIQAIYDIAVTNNGEVPFPSVDITDFVLENLVGGVPPGIVISCVPSDPPWNNNALGVNASFNATCTVTLDDFAEATLLAQNDLTPATSNVIENQIQAVQPTFDPDPICGPVEEQAVSSGIVKIILQPPPNGEIPALDWKGILLMILALSGVIVWRSMRNN